MAVTIIPALMFEEILKTTTGLYVMSLILDSPQKRDISVFKFTFPSNQLQFVSPFLKRYRVFVNTSPQTLKLNTFSVLGTDTQGRTTIEIVTSTKTAIQLHYSVLYWATSLISIGS